MDQKQARAEFKFFKNNYTFMNKIKAEYIYLSGKLNDQQRLLSEIGENDMGKYFLLYFDGVSAFYKVYGRFVIETEFHKWLSDKTVRLTPAEFKQLGTVLQKDIVDVILTDTAAIFESNNEDGSLNKFILEHKPEYDDKIIKEYKFMDECEFKNSAEIPIIIDNESLVIFYDSSSNKPVYENTNDKLLEVPAGALKILAIPVADAKNVLEYSDKTESGGRYVKLTCIEPTSKESKGKELSQIFLTI